MNSASIAAGRVLPSGREHWWLAGACVVSLALRFCLFGFISGDMEGDMLPWTDFIRSNGGFPSLGKEFSNYPPLYLYLLTVAAYLPLPRLYAIKAVYLVFDYVLAFYVWRIVRRNGVGDRVAAWAALAVLFLPTVVMNSSLWGQCDAMYAAGLIACVYYLLEGRHTAALVAFGLALSLKPQAVFLAPLLAVLLLRGRFSALLLYVPAAVYLVLALPAWLAGRSLADLVFLYAHQKILPFPSLTLGATNLYQWLPDDRFDALFPVGLSLAAAAAVAYVFLLRRKTATDLRDVRVVEAALLSLVLMPYVLPAMHERYFFAADVLAVAYAFLTPRRWIVAALIQTASVFTYLPYLFDREPIPRPFLAVLMTVALAVLVRDQFVGQAAQAGEATLAPRELPVAARSNAPE